MQVVIATLLIYSLISTIIIELSGENDTVIAIFAFGPIGLLLIAIAKVYSRIRQYFKYDGFHAQTSDRRSRSGSGNR